jgi:hypothetical protein
MILSFDIDTKTADDCVCGMCRFLEWKNRHCKELVCSFFEVKILHSFRCEQCVKYQEKIMRRPE